MTEVEVPPFTHLHVHSEYSLFDGTIKIKELIRRVKERGHTHVALTDHGNMHAAIEFYQEAKANGIHPILGIEIYHPAPKSLVAHAATLNLTLPKAFHLVVLAKNMAGYRNLLKIASLGYLEGNLHDVPMVPLNELYAHSQGLFVLSACQMGLFGFLVKQICHGVAAESPVFSSSHPVDSPFLSMLSSFVSDLRIHFEPQSVYVELVDNQLPGQKALIDRLVEAATYYDLPYVATADAHYLDPDHKEIHALAVAIKNKLTLKDIRKRLRQSRFHLLSAEEMSLSFSQWPKALSASNDIASACSGLKIPMGTYFLPKIDLGTGETPVDALRRLANEGLEDRLSLLVKLYPEGTFTEEKYKEYRDRVNYELTVIIEMGFCDYFLIVQDFIGWAKKQDIPVGPGRGSGAGSLVAYALQITDIDPIPYTLIFERFLNPERVSMPDFDIDFCQWRRDEVIAYCLRKYGVNRLAQITTFGKMQAKAAVKSVGRAMNLAYSRVDIFTKLFPPDLGMTLEKALEMEPRLQEAMNKDEELQTCMDSARQLEGLVSHTSVHAAGIVISATDMTDYLPIYTTDGKTLITQYEMKPTEKVGLVKFDFLGLKTLTVIHKAVQLIRQGPNPEFDIRTIALQENAVFELLSAGNTCGIFQCEGGGITQLITKLKPSTFEDIIALVALFRPGPLGSGMVDDFVERKHGRQTIKYLHPLLEPILRDTYGMILYQEQVQKIAAVLANYSLGEADLLRRAMGKKIAEEMAQQKDRFLQGAADNQVDSKIAEEIFDLMAEFANYGFNKSHSAAYGLVSYQTAYLKTYFPEPFFAASMTCDLDNTDKVVRYIEDAQRQNIEILPPCVQNSEVAFSVPGKNQIRYGLAAIKGIGEAAVRPIIEARLQGGTFQDLADFAHKVELSKLGKKTLQLLACVGVFDAFGYSRQFLIDHAEAWMQFSFQHHESKRSGQRNLFALSSLTEAPTIRPLLWPEHQTLGKKWKFFHLLEEKRVLGVYFTTHPFHAFAEDQRCFSNTKIKDLPHLIPSDGKPFQRKSVRMVAFLEAVTYKRTKKGTLMAFIRIEDAHSSVEAILFGDKVKPETMPPLRTPVLCEGSVSPGMDGSGFRFLLDEVNSLQSFREKQVRKITLAFRSERIESLDFFSSFSNCLDMYPGSVEVEIKLHFEHVVLLFSTAKRISVSDACLQDLQNLIHTRIQYHS
jgi:DNA polymerase-3 subunit alpha